jgi:hypothetical protein
MGVTPSLGTIGGLGTESETSTSPGDFGSESGES